MICVRFPTGLVLQYNDVHYLERRDGYTDGRDAEGGKLIAQVPNTCVIEYVTPCRVFQEDGSSREGDLHATIARLRRQVARAKLKANPARKRRTLPTRGR